MKPHTLFLCFQKPKQDAMTTTFSKGEDRMTYEPSNPVIMVGAGWLGLETALVINFTFSPMAVSFLAWPDARILDDSVDALFFGGDPKCGIGVE